MRRRSARFSHLLMFAFMALAFTLAGCGKATKDSAESRYRAARDKLQLITAKNAMMKPAIDEQMRTFDKDFEIAKAKTPDEEAIKSMADVASRVEKYEADLSKSMAPAAGAPPVGAPPVGAPVAPPVGGKLGAPVGAPPAPAGLPGGGMPGGGMPGGAMPGGGMPGGKLGGGAPPAAPVAPPQGGSGFGGQ